MENLHIRDDEEAIRAALTALRGTSGIPVTLYAAVLPDQRLQITSWIGLRTPALQNLIIDQGCGVGGKVVNTRQAVGVTDYARADNITHEYDRPVADEGIISLVGVPIIVRRDVRGVLYVGVHSAVRLGSKVLEEVRTTARILEQDLAVNDALRRLDPARTFNGSGEGGRGMNGAEWEQVRAAHSRLRMLANHIDDIDIATEIEEICEQMVTPVRVQQTTKLSARELDVLACVALGHTNMEAADEMGIGPETVKSYLRSVMRKLGAHTRYEAVTAARRMGALP
ncbi:MAG: LuxR C-terminal-related transcriptional regulator [Corynebacterium sp.]|nr:LuxR C-terminal-related transcriptional regulator [Corynebacterium sp.]